jgi:hypothetical protein
MIEFDDRDLEKALGEREGVKTLERGNVGALECGNVEAKTGKKVSAHKMILRILCMRQAAGDKPYISIRELRELTACESADVRIRELRREIDGEFGCFQGNYWMENFNNARKILEDRKLIRRVHAGDMNYGTGKIGNLASGIAVFRMKGQGGRYYWNYMLTVPERDILKKWPSLWKAD